MTQAARALLSHPHGNKMSSQAATEEHGCMGQHLHAGKKQRELTPLHGSWFSPHRKDEGKAA